MNKTLLILAIGLTVGSAATWWYDHRTGPVEPSAPQSRQSDNSLLLAHNQSQPPKKPPHVIPSGSKVKESIHLEVQPKQAGCPICTADLSVVELTNGTHRVIASSPDGTVIAGRDFTFDRLPKQTQWAFGAVYNGRWGAILVHDVGPFQLGGLVTKDEFGIKPWAVAMFRW